MTTHVCVCIKIAGWNILEVTTLTSFYPLPSITEAYKACIVQLFLFIRLSFSHHKGLAEWMDEKFTFNSVEICLMCAKKHKVHVRSCATGTLRRSLPYSISFPYNISKATNQYRSSIGWKTTVLTGIGEHYEQWKTSPSLCPLLNYTKHTQKRWCK